LVLTKRMRGLDDNKMPKHSQWTFCASTASVHIHGASPKRPVRISGTNTICHCTNLPNEVICGVLHIALASLCDILLFIYSYSTVGTNIPFIYQFYINRVNLISCVGMELVLLFSEFNKGVVTKTELFRA
jgi:hypothetical protein